jgi:menaquinol-cytochrome c reductase iron-sulfur subunit
MPQNEIQRESMTLGSAQPGRRSFLQTLIYGLWSLIGVGLAAPAVTYLSRPRRAAAETWVDAGPLNELPLNSPDEVVFRRSRLDGWKLISEKATAWVIRPSEATVVAFDPRCPHLGCAYHWEQGKKLFVCPCHASTFGLDGGVLSGPAPRPLDRYQAKVEDGHLWLGPLARTEEKQS